MTISRKLRRPAAAVVAVAAVATVLTACSSDDDSAAATSTTQSAEATSTDAATTGEAVDGLDAAQAQVIIRTAVSADTSLDDLEKVLDTSLPGVAQALNGFAKGAEKAGYTPDVYTVKSVKADGQDKAIAVTAVKSPHAPEPVDLDLALVRKDGEWKLAGPAVTTLTSMGR
ncbi:hypothetical protein [Gordonia hydrophobica]|uniref:Low molecular weight antigen MTB12-like C-terminal domain-containing protein n=1 Tax=Gordonia hydrophobica TaxID=40516 RepID=A0ABZ2TWL6_9ACTN|nr:hypothetical protein [Gordonia hydrophobica]MBM7369283.1 hypothetical protein [Gordonia hydrophobica]